jgi:parvulin-like peptidyl-prolyl isomerase
MGIETLVNFVRLARKLTKKSSRFRLHVSLQRLHRIMIFSPGSRSLAIRARAFVVVLPLFAVLALLTACHKPAVSDPADPAFIVAGAATPTGTWTITRADLDKQVDAALTQRGATRAQVPAGQLPKVETQVLRFMVVKKLLLAQSSTMTLPDVDKQVAQAIEYTKNRNPGHTYTDAELADALKSHGLTMDEWKQELHESATMQAVLDQATAKSTEPSEQEIDAIYNDHKDAFNVPPMVRASRVLILASPTDTPAQKADKKKRIDAAHARVVKGEDISKVATEVSEDRSTAPRGGDMGKFPRGQNEAGFDDVAFKTKVNTVSPVFETSLGYQFIKVTDSSPAGLISLAEARTIIAPKLRDMKKQQAENAYAQSLLATSGVSFYLKDLDSTAPPPAPGAPSAGQSAPPDQSPPPAPDQGSAPAPTPVQASAPSANPPATNAAPKP